MEEILSDLRHLNVARVSDDTEGGQEPYDHTDYNDSVEDLLDFSVHGDVGVDQPEQNANHD